MDTDKPTSENRTISSLCVLKRKLKHSRRAHIQKQATDTHHPLILEDQKQKLSSLAGKIRNAQGYSHRPPNPIQTNNQRPKYKIRHLAAVK